MRATQYLVGAEQLGRDMNATSLQFRHELGSDTRSAEFADDAAVRLRRPAIEAEDLLHGDHLALHTRDLLQAHQATATITHALELQHDMNGGGDLRADAAGGPVQAGHADHLLEPRQGVAA